MRHTTPATAPVNRGVVVAALLGFDRGPPDGILPVTVADRGGEEILVGSYAPRSGELHLVRVVAGSDRTPSAAAKDRDADGSSEGVVGALELETATGHTECGLQPDTTLEFSAGVLDGVDVPLQKLMIRPPSWIGDLLKREGGATIEHPLGRSDDVDG